MSETIEENDSELDALLDLLHDSEGQLNNSCQNDKTMIGKDKNPLLSNYNSLEPEKDSQLVNQNLGIQKDERKIESTFDPLEEELKQMEEKMKKLKEEIIKNKNIKTSTESSFTKISRAINPDINISLNSTRYLNKEEESKLYQNISKKKSEIHSGETDSEDEEEKRMPFEAHLCSYGKEVKKRLAHSSRDSSGPCTSKPVAGWKRAGGGSLLSMNKAIPQIQKERDESCDVFSGIRIINPVISNDAMKEMMEGRRMIQMSVIPSHMRGGEIDGDWVTIGVIVSKSETKTSQKGSKYIVWQLSDLKDCTKVVSLFLFGDAYKNLWKNTVGSVVGILNPQIMKESNKQGDGRNILTLSVNTHEKILLMGTSKDLGWCKGRTKQNGTCRSFVNKNVCEFCVFHIQREYKKMSARRSEIQSSFTRIDPRKAFQKKVLGKEQVFYGGQLYGCGSSKQPSGKKLPHATKTKDLATLSSLSLKLKADTLKDKDLKDSFILKHLSEDQVSTVSKVSRDNEELGQMLLAPSPGARNLLMHKTNKSQLPRGKEESSVSCPPTISAKDFLKSTIAEHKQNSISKAIPQLGRGLSPGKTLEIDFTNSTNLDPAKAKAISVLKKKGEIQSTAKNMPRNKQKASNLSYQKEIKKRVRESTGEEGSLTPSKVPKNESKSPFFETGTKKSLLGSLDINSEMFQSMISATSRHTNLIEAAEDEEVEKYYSSLEKKEMLENKMASTMEMPVSAVVCLNCKYKAFSAAEHCKEEKHTLKVVKALKRFFECRNCKQRTVSLERIPSRSCSHCSNSSWRRVAMAKEKRGPTLDSEVLSLRGDELSHVSSASNKVYLNL